MNGERDAADRIQELEDRCWRYSLMLEELKRDCEKRLANADALIANLTEQRDKSEQMLGER